MSKAERKCFIMSVWQYIQTALTEAYESRDEISFDWYSDGSSALWCALNDKPIKFVTRIKPLY